MARLFGRRGGADEPAEEAGDEPAVDEASPSAHEAPDVRADGPWDSTERDTTGDESYVDLGALRLRGREGMEIRLQSDGEDGVVAAALVMTEDSALEVRVFAGPRSGGLWDEVRAEIVAEVERVEGEVEQVDGPFGAEVRVQLPVTLDDGQAGIQPSRIVAVEGPRWLLRGTFLGLAALEPSDDGPLIDAFRDVVVARGDGPMMAREPLLLTIPEAAVAVAADEAPDGPDDSFDSSDGRE